MNYKLIKSFRKTMSLQIKNGEVIVKAPFFTNDITINNFIWKHINWIKKRLEVDKNKVLFSQEDISNLKAEAKGYIPARVTKIANSFWLEFNNIKITSAKTRWGSCTSKKSLNFSYRLMATPKEVIDYVIIHELAHLRHMNHSRSFWLEVERMMPEYKLHEKWLKNHWSLIW